jgi:hypothetical protein
VTFRETQSERVENRKVKLENKKNKLRGLASLRDCQNEKLGLKKTVMKSIRPANSNKREFLKIAPQLLELIPVFPNQEEGIFWSVRT